MNFHLTYKYISTYLYISRNNKAIMTGRIKELANIFKALSDPTRLQLVMLLSECNCGDDEINLCVMALTKRLNVSQSAVSQHLRVLRQADLVESKRIGYHVHYSINRKTIEKYRDQIRTIMGADIV